MANLTGLDAIWRPVMVSCSMSRTTPRIVSSDRPCSPSRPQNWSQQGSSIPPVAHARARDATLPSPAGCPRPHAWTRSLNWGSHLHHTTPGHGSSAWEPVSVPHWCPCSTAAHLSMSASWPSCLHSRYCDEATTHLVSESSASTASRSQRCYAVSRTLSPHMPSLVVVVALTSLCDNMRGTAPSFQLRQPPLLIFRSLPQICDLKP